ncbi:bacteriohemerythrin [Geothrix sp. 21YS21S-4]|uniref:bacteriohemerythrin n=1 Tax=Geothrix sp. 21YS21S-4 TaxID=3068889 RepID=UPI0027B9C29A|nr:hemerythrin domain-containing protein [Geothrix sp. 21YS21S-4]
MGNPNTFLRWRRQFELGLEPIDAQHRELVDALQRLEGLLAGEGGAAVDEELASVARHLVRHCQTEESLMKEMGFPDRVAHAEEHQSLIRAVRDLQYRRLRGAAVGREEIVLLGEALDCHICEWDRAYADQLKAVQHV